MQSVWFCSNRRRKLGVFLRHGSVFGSVSHELVIRTEMETGDSEKGKQDGRGAATNFSRAILSLLMRSRASVILLSTYWLAR